MPDDKSNNNKSNNNRFFKSSVYSAGGLVMVFVILILVNVVFSHVSLRLDLTEDNLYSLSEGSKKILSNLKQDVTIKFFYSRSSEDLSPAFKTYAGRVLDFLSEYEHFSGSKIQIEQYDPKADSDEEEWADKYGLEGVELATGDKLYLGLVAVAADQEEAIKFLDPRKEQNLEYDITRIISRVQKARKLKIGIISALEIFGKPYPAPGQPQGAPEWMFLKELKKTYEIDQIDMKSGAVADDTDLLILFHAKGLSADLMYQTDQFVLKGGNVMVFADPLSVMDISRSPIKSSVPKKLLGAWGIEIDSDQAVVDYDYSTKLRGQDNQPEDNPLWLSLKSDALNSENLITAKLESMILPVVGSIKKKEGATCQVETLLTSSKNSATTPTSDARGGVDKIRQKFAPTPEDYGFAVLVTGTFDTAFPDGPPEGKKPDAPADNNEKKAVEDHIAKSKEKTSILVVADADFLYDGYYMSTQNFLGMTIANFFNDNLHFFQNACEMMTGSDELINIRSRGKFERPFVKVRELEKSAQAKWLATEQKLVAEYEAAKSRLEALENKKDASQKLILSPDQEKEIKKFEAQNKQINKELKEVRKKLRADIEALGRVLKFINILLIPMLVAFTGVIYGLYRQNKSKK